MSSTTSTSAQKTFLSRLLTYISTYLSLVKGQDKNHYTSSMPPFSELDACISWACTNANRLSFTMNAWCRDWNKAAGKSINFNKCRSWMPGMLREYERTIKPFLSFHLQAMFNASFECLQKAFHAAKKSEIEFEAQQAKDAILALSRDVNSNKVPALLLDEKLIDDLLSNDGGFDSDFHYEHRNVLTPQLVKFMLQKTTEQKLKDRYKTAVPLSNLGFFRDAFKEWKVTEDGIRGCQLFMKQYIISTVEDSALDSEPRLKAEYTRVLYKAFDSHLSSLVEQAEDGKRNGVQVCFSEAEWIQVITSMERLESMTLENAKDEVERRALEANGSITIAELAKLVPKLEAVKPEPRNVHSEIKMLDVSRPQVSGSRGRGVRRRSRSSSLCSSTSPSRKNRNKRCADSDFGERLPKQVRSVC